MRHSVVLSLDLLFKMIFVPMFAYIALHLLTFWKACKYGIAVV